MTPGDDRKAEVVGANVHGSKRLLPALTGVRGVAATWVIVEHFWEYIRSFAPELRFLERWVVSGFLSVEVFFTLSGFIIAYNYADEFVGVTKAAYRRFIINRFARIYPVHLVTLVGAVVLVGGAKVLGIELTTPFERTPLTFLWNVLLLHGVVYVRAYNPPAWSVSVEFVAYVIFPFLAVWLVRFRSARSAFIACGVVTFIGTGAMLAIGHWVGPLSTGRAMFWARISTEFLAGVLLWKGWSQMREQQGRWGDALVWGSLVIVFAYLTLVDATSVFVPEVFAMTPLIVLFILGCAAAVGSAQSFLGSRIIEWSGRVSYSLYLTHFLILIPVGKIWPAEEHSGVALPLKIGWILFWLSACYVAAHLMYTIVEERGRRWIRRRVLSEGPPVEDPAATS